MPSAIDITKPIYGTPTTQSVRDNFHIARDEITELQDMADSHVNRSGDTMTGPLMLYGNPQAQKEATTLEWVLNQLHSTINTMIYVGDYDGATDKIISSGVPQFVINTALPVPIPSMSQHYFTVKTTHPPPGIGNQPPEGVTQGTYLLCNGVAWINFAMTAANVTAKTVPVDAPAIPNVNGLNVYDALHDIGQNYLMKSGGTLTNFLTLHAAPTANFHAATKKYTDDAIAGLVFPSEAPKDAFHYARGNGAWASNPTFSKLVVTSQTWGHIQLNSSIASNTANQILGFKDGIARWDINLGDSQSNANFGIARFDNAGVNLDSGLGYVLAIDRLIGDVTISRNLMLNPTVTTTASIFGRGANNPTNPIDDTLNIWARSNGGGATIGIRGPTFPNIPNGIQLHAGATSQYAWFFYSGGTLVTPGHVLIPPNYYFGWNNPATSWITGDSSGNLLIYGNPDWRMYWAAADGVWRWQGPPNYVDLMSLDGGGSLYVKGWATVAGRLKANEIMNESGAFYVANNTAYGLIRSAADGYWRFYDNNIAIVQISTAGLLIANSSIYSYGARIISQGNSNNPSLCCYDTAGFAAGMFAGGGGTLYFSGMDGGGGFISSQIWGYFQGPNFYVSAAITAGDRVVATSHMSCNSVGIQYPNVSGTNGFNFRWDGSNILGRVDNSVELPISNYASDERIKADLAPSTFDCLDAIRKTPLFQFRFRKGMGGEDAKQIFTAEPQQGLPVIPIGFVAQKQYEVFPESVVKGDDEMGAGPEGSTQLWTMNNNTLIATLFGAVKELIARIEVLETALAPGVKH
jgi:hypothetical protein